MIEIKRYASKSDQGPHLQTNEDLVEVDFVNGLYFVLDGFGGSGIGDKASQALKEDIKKFYLNIGSDPDSTLPFFYSPRYLVEGNALINALLFANAKLVKDNRDKSMNERGGASGLFVSLAETIATIVSVGNARVFLYRSGHLKEIINPDSLDSFSVDNFQKHYCTAPLSAFGLYEDLQFVAREVRIVEDDLLLCLTDGAYGRIQVEELRSIISKNSGQLEKIDEIFKINNSRGNLDNQTGLILNF